jgi:hypothetical protein
MLYMEVPLCAWENAGGCVLEYVQVHMCKCICAHMCVGVTACMYSGTPIYVP